MINNQELDRKKCYSCGKIFRTPADLLKHKNRKTPCLIREVPPEHVNNPNRCIFCNRVFSKKENLTKHIKTCKVKNGGMDILVDKVKYEQEIRILKEQIAQRNRENDEQIAQRNRENDEQIQQLREELSALKLAVLNPQHVPAQNITNNYGPVFNIMINNYTTPTLAGITISPAELSSADKISKLLLQKLYFNPEVPQNHCMYLQNKKTKSMIVYDEGRWRPIEGDNTNEVLMKLNNTIMIAGQDMKGPVGPYITDETFVKLSLADQQKIRDFNVIKNALGPLGSDDAFEIFLAGRDTVINTIKAAGCKLV